MSRLCNRTQQKGYRTRSDKNPTGRFNLSEVFIRLLFVLGEYAYQVNLIMHQGKTEKTDQVFFIYPAWARRGVICTCVLQY